MMGLSYLPKLLLKLSAIWDTECGAVNGKDTVVLVCDEGGMLIDKAAGCIEKFNKRAVRELSSRLRDRAPRYPTFRNIPAEKSLEKLVELVLERAF
ncbi:hypothetical protein APED_05105 [Acanthopleuribacter pedis]